MRLEEELKSTKFKSEIHKANINIMFTAGLIRNAVARFLKDFGLTPEQYNVLRILNGQWPGNICMREINCRMIDKSSNTTRIIDKLLAKDLVTRDGSDHDRREIVCGITEKGRKLIDDINMGMNSQDPHICGLSETEAQLLNALLDKIRE